MNIAQSYRLGSLASHVTALLGLARPSSGTVWGSKLPPSQIICSSTSSGSGLPEKRKMARSTLREISGVLTWNKLL